MTEYHYSSNFKVLTVLLEEGPQGLLGDGVYRGQGSEQVLDDARGPVPHL
jgi:hypothetical protein